MKKTVKHGVRNAPRRLPTVTLDNGKTYFVDRRLRQLRNVENPHDYIDYGDYVAVGCPKCGRILFRGTRQEAQSLSICCPECC